MPNPNNEDIKWLYGKLKSKGYNIGSEQEFTSSLANDADRQWYYEKAKGMGLNIGSMDDFNSLYAPAKSQPAHQTQSQPAKPQPKAAAPVHSATTQPAKPQPAARQQPVTYFRLRRGGKDFNVSADEVRRAGGLQAWANRHPGAPVRVYMQGNGFNGHVDLSQAHNRLVTKGYKYSTTTAQRPVQTASKPVKAVAPSHSKPSGKPMTEAQKAAAIANVQGIMDNATASYQRTQQQLKNMQDYRKKAGFANYGATVKGGVEFNPSTGKMEQTYLTPQGDKTTSKAAADVRSGKFRQQEQFYGRMTDNGLDPNKKEDVQKQMQLDEEKPMRDVLDDVWGEAEAKDKKAQEAWINRADKNARGFSLSDAAAASSSAGAVFAGRGEDFNNDLEYQKQRHSIFDFEKMANTMYSRLPEDYRNSTLARYTDYFKKHPKDAKGKTAAVAAKEALMGELYRQVYDRAKAQSMPKSKLEFLLRKIADQPLISSSMAANTVAAWQTGSHGLDLAEQDAMSVYGSRHKALNIAGTVANMALDPVTYAAGGVGGVVGKEALHIVGKQALKGATKKVAERYAAGTLAGRVAQGVAGGAANFGTFNTVKGIQQQMAVGGTLDENGKPTNELSAGDILKETAHGLMLGAATGTLSPLIGNVADKAVKATSSTAGKVALRAGQTAVSTLAEGTVFAIPDMVDKGKWDWDTWTDSQAMMLGFKASHAIKSAPRVLDALRTDGKRYGLSFEERLRKQMDASPSDIGFKPEELDELRDKGYMDLSMLFRNANSVKKNGKSTEFDRRTDPYENLAPDTFDGYEAMKQLMNDNSVSEATRAKAYYILTGHMLPMSTVTGYTQDRADDGSVVVNSVNARGGVVTTRRFANEQAAQQEKDNIMRQAELNSVTVGEKYKETASNMMVVEQAIKEVAPDADVATVMNNYKQVKDGRLTDEAYVKQAQAIDEAIERNRHIADPNRPEAIRENIKKETGIDVDATLRKMPTKRTEKEQAVVDEYVRSLFPEQKRNENETEEQPTADEAADAEFNNRLEQRQQSYDEGRAAFETADTEGDRSDSDAIMQRVKEAYEEIDRVFGEDAEMRLAQLEDDPWEVAQDESLTEEQQDAVAYFINAKAAMDGLTDAANDNAENKRADIDRKVEQHTNKQTGMIHPATLKVDNRPVYIVSGNVVMFPDGSGVDKANSSESVVICDAETGEVKFVSPDMIYSVEEPISADQERQAAYDAIESEQQVILGNDELDGSLLKPKQNPQQGDDVWVNDENGENVHGVITQVDPMTGEYMVQTDEPVYGKKVQPFTQDYLYDMVQNDNLQEPEQPESEQQEPEQPQFTQEGIDNAFNADLAQRTGADTNLQGEGLREAAAQQAQYIQQTIDDQKQMQTQAEAQRHAAEEQEMAKPLYRIPKDDNGTPMLEETDPETAWDGVVQYMDDNADDAREYVDGMVTQLTKDVENAKKAVSKIKPTTDLAAFKQAKAEARQAQADAEARLEKWQQIANVNKSRQKAERDRIAAERAEADRIAHEEANARLVEQKRIEAEKKAEQEAIGTHAVNPKIKAKWDNAPKVVGNADIITLPDGSQLRGHYVLTEAGAATASHDVNNGFQPTEGFPIDENGQSVNDRDYARDKEAQGLVRSIADSYDNRALQSPVIVSQDGIVLSGNNRTMSGDIAASNNTDSSYNNYVREFGQKYGFEANTVNGMKHPRVLFVPDEELPYDAKTFARFNAQEMKSQSKPEAAVKLGKIVPDKTFSHIVNAISKYDRLPDFYANENEVNNSLRELMGAGVINDKQLPELRTGNALSAQGKELLENILIGKVFQSNPDAVRQIISHPALKQTIVMALGEIANNRTLASKQYDLSEELGNAVDLVCRAKDAAPDVYREGMLVSPFGRQHGLFDDEYGDSTVKDATTLLLADVLNSSKPSDLRKILATYNNEAVQAANGQLDLFTGRVKSKEELLKEILKQFNNATPKEKQALVDKAVEDRKRRAAESEQADAAETGSGQTESGTAEGGTAYERGRQGDISDSERRQHGAVAEARIKLSKEKDENGNPFVLGKTGNLDLGYIDVSQANGISTNVSGPIRLPYGNEGYGYVHMQKHLDQLKQNGYQSVEDFAEAVANGKDEIRQGNVYLDEATGEGKETYLLVKKGKKGSVLYIELVPDREYYIINSGGVFKNSYISKRKELWSASTEHSAASGEPQDFPLAQHTPESDNVSALSQGSSAAKIGKTSEKGDKKTEKVASEGNEGIEKLKKRPQLWAGSANITPALDSATKPVTTLDAQQGGEQIGSASGQSGLSEAKNAVPASSSDIETEPEGKRNGTAAPQNGPSSIGKDNKSSDTKQEKTAENFQQPIGATTDEATKQAERDKVNTQPSDAQKEAGNYAKGHIKVDGYDVTIENPKGSTRSGKDANGKEWSIKMNYDYGYIKGITGVDGDHIDVYLSDNPTSGNVYVVDQIDQQTGKFDEHKVMYGFPNKEAAIEAYKSQYEKGWKVGTVTEVSREDFKKWIESSKRKTKPFADYKSMEAAAKQQRTEPSCKKTEEKPKAKRTPDTKIEDVGEHLKGARKDMLREIAKSLANITEAELVEKPFGKVYKKPDLKKAVESGVLREKDAIFYEALFSMVNQQKPKVTQSDMRSKRYIPDHKTKAERWAADTFKQMEVLRQFMELDEPGRDAMMERMLADRYPTREQELAEIEKRKGLNPDYEGHKYEWGDKTTPNPLWVTHEVMNRMGYNVGDKLDIPFGVVEANTSGTGYSIKNLKGERAWLFGSDMTLDEAIDRIVYLAKLKRGDADLSHPTQLFAFPATKSEMGESGRYRVMWGRDYKTRDFGSKEEADAFAATKSGAYVSPINEVKRRFGYKVRFTHPLTGEKMFVDDAEFDTKEEAQAYFDGNFEKLNDATNAKLEAERSKKGEKKVVAADDVVHATMVHSGKGGWTHAVVIDKKYANNNGEDSIIKEGFASRKDAVDYANSIKDEVLKALLAHKEEGKKVVYFDTGKDSRIGPDYRSGKDVAAEDFMNTFGFRGVQFGNWTNQEDRQMALNQAYDALMDLANVIGVSPQAISLNGELGIAFGSRGSGNANAHYEPNNVVINLTKTRGAGSLAHEWWHALDNYFARRVGRPLGMVTDNREIAMRAELREAFNNMLDLVEKSDYARRSRARGEYWGSMHEITARLLSEWIDNELKKRSELNTFLTRGANVELWQRYNYKAYESIERIAGREPMSFENFKERPESLSGFPYPSTKEVEQFGASLRHIFDTIEERVDEKTGMHALLSKVRGEAKPVSEDEAALRDAVMDLEREAGLDVIDDVEEGQRVLDMANGRVRQMSFGEPYDYDAYPLGRVEPNLAEKEVAVVEADANHGFANYKEAKAWAKQHVSKVYNNEETGGKGDVRISNAAIDKFMSQSAVDKNDGKDVHMSVLKVLPEVLKNSIDVETHPDFLKGADGKRRPENGMNKDVLVHRCYGAVSIDGKPYRVKITLKEDPRDVSFPHVTHSYEATKIELLAGTWENQEGPSPNTNNSIPAANLLKNVGLSYNPSEKVLDASEKRTESIREQRVYHGSAADFDAFDTMNHLSEGEGNQAFGAGTYVADQKELGKKYAEIASSNPGNRKVYIDGKAVSLNQLKRDTPEHAAMWYLVNHRGFKTLALNRIKDNIAFSKKHGLLEKAEIDQKAYDLIKDDRISYKEEKPARYIYDVEIPDDNGKNYLDWDGELTRKQADTIRKKLYDAVLARDDDYKGAEKYLAQDLSVIKDGRHIGDSYGTISDYLGSDKAASEFLHDLGYTGFKVHAAHNSSDKQYKNNWNYVIFNDKDLKIKDKVRFFRTADGYAYGYTVGGKIYIDPRIATSETPIHEYAHLWAEALRKANPKEWQNVVELMKGTWAWDYVRKQYPELETDDEIAEEALAHFSGKRGAERLRQAAREEADKTDGVIGKAGVWSVFSRIKEALEKFWQGVSDFLHIHFTSAEEVADKVMDDLLNHVNPANEARKLAEERDKEYLQAVKDGDMEKAQRMVNEEAERNGYSTGSDYQGTSAFNGSAPYGNDYFFGKEERKEAWEGGDYEGNTSLGDYIDNGVDGGNLEELTNDASLRHADDMRKEAIRNVRAVIRGKKKTITMYRSVPSSVKEGSFRNGDWVTPSRKYAEDNAKVHGWGDEYRIIEQEVPVDDVWFDGNDIAEWGYGREQDFVNDKDFAYKNTQNNKKLLDAVTYDDEGNVIPLSKRFDAQKADIRYSKRTKAEEKTLMGVVTYDKNKEGDRQEKVMGAVRESNGILFRDDEEEESIDDVNERFNNELDAFKNKTSKGLLHLGKPSPILKACGIDVDELTLSPSVLYEHLKKHGLTTDDLKGLVNALRTPILVYQHGKNVPNMVVVTELDTSKGKLSVSLRLDENGNVVDMANISSVHGKDASVEIERLSEMGEDLKTALRYADKTKVSDWLMSSPYKEAGTPNHQKLLSVAKIINDFENPVIKGENFSTSTEDPNGDSVKYRSVPEGALLDFLNGQPTRKGYRYAQWANFGVLPPMTAKVDGEWRPPMIFSQWEQSEEGMRKTNGKADLVQGNGRITGDVAYNPYFHIRTSPLNDQFTAAYDRPELVVVEGEYPVSELTSGYHAQGAKNSVGLMDWHSGSVNGQLSDDTKVQTMLSRYFRPVRIVPWSEVADRIMERVGDQDITFPINAVPPMLRAELAKRGAKFGEISGQVKEDDIPMLEDLRKRINAGEWDAGLDKAKAYLDAYESSDEAKEARTEQISAELNTPIKVVKDPEEIASLPSRRKRMAKGWFEESTGEVVVMLPNNVNVADVDNTVVHEVVGHNGLRKLIGEERFNEFLDEVHEHAGGTVRKAIDKIEKNLVDNEVDRLTREKEAEPDRPNNRKGVFARAEATVEAEKKRQEFRREATEEYMADMAGRIGNEGFKKMDREQLTFWGRVKAKVQQFLDKFLRRLRIPKSIKLSDKDVAYILYKSWKNLRNGGKPTIVDEAEDAVMRSKTHYDEVDSNMNDAPEPRTWGKKDLLSKAEEVSHGIDPKTYFRDSIEDNDNTARETYDTWADAATSKLREAWQDSMINVRNLQDAVLKQRGEKIEDWEDAYNEENRSHGQSRAESEYFTDNFYKPLLKSVNAVAKSANVSIGDVMTYMMAKHGLERNEVFAKRDADAAWKKYEEKKQGEFAEYLATHPNGKKTIDDFMDHSYDDFYNAFRKRDYSGITALTDTDNVIDAEAEAQRIVAGMEGKADTTELWKRTNAATEWTLQKAYNSGIISKDNFEQVRDMFENYIPLRGWEEDTAGDIYDYVGSGDNGTAFSPTLHKAKGRSSQADNPIAYIGSMAVSAIVQGNKNKVKQTFMRFVENHPTNLVTVSEMWYRNFGTDTNPDWREDVPYIPEDATADEIVHIVEQHEADMKQLEAQGLATKQRGHLHLNVPVKKGQALEHHVEVMVNGKKYVLYINGNPRAAQALNGTRMRRASEHSFESRKIANFGRKLAERYTSLSPSFTVSNAFRDLTMAAISTAIKENPAYAMNFRMNVVRLGGPVRMFTLMNWYKKAAQQQIPVQQMSKIQRYFYEFMTQGAETGFTSLKEIDDYKADMEKMYMNMNQRLINPKRLFRGLAEGLEYTNRCIEDMTRFATYMTSRESGRSVRESVSDAKNITLNFNRKGSGEKGNTSYRNLQIFVNPAIQSLQNVASMAMDHPVKFTLLTGAVALIGAAMPFATLLLWSMFGDNADNNDKWNAVDEYWKLPTWQRRNNLVMWIPGTKKFAMIPLAQEFRVFHGFGETMTSVLTGNSSENPALELMTQASDLLPLDFAGNNGNVLVNLAPTVTQPLLQIGFNTDFTGRPLYKDNDFNKYEPAFQKAYIGTPRWLIKSSEMINDLTGGNEHKQGIWEQTKVGSQLNNPAVVDHLLKGYYGGMYSFLAQLGGTVYTLGSGELPDVQEVPIANRVVTAVRETQQNGKTKLPDWYYDMMEDNNRWQIEKNGYKKDFMQGDADAKQKWLNLEHDAIQQKRNAYISAVNKIRTAIANTNDLEQKTRLTALQNQMLDKLKSLSTGDTSK